MAKEEQMMIDNGCPICGQTSSSVNPPLDVNLSGQNPTDIMLLVIIFPVFSICCTGKA